MKAKFSAYLKESEKSPVIVTRNGKPVAVLLSVADEDEIERLILNYSPKFRRLLADSKKKPSQLRREAVIRIFRKMWNRRHNANRKTGLSKPVFFHCVFMPSSVRPAIFATIFDFRRSVFPEGYRSR